MTDISTAAGLAEYRASTFVKPEPPAVEAMSVTIHMRVEPGHEIDGREPAVVLWMRSTYSDDYAPRPSIMTAHHEIIETPDPLPEWVPRPPAVWLALTAAIKAWVA